MTEFRVWNITCQIAGQVMPVAKFTLAGGEAVFFEQLDGNGSAATTGSPPTGPGGPASPWHPPGPLPSRCTVDRTGRQCESHADERVSHAD